MIYGVGTDLIEIQRIDKALKRFGERAQDFRSPPEVHDRDRLLPDPVRRQGREAQLILAGRHSADCERPVGRNVDRVADPLPVQRAARIGLMPFHPPQFALLVGQAGGRSY